MQNYCVTLGWATPRRNFIISTDLRDKIHKVIEGVCRRKKWGVVDMWKGGERSVMVRVELDARTSPYTAVKAFKLATSKLRRIKKYDLARFPSMWTSDYIATNGVITDLAVYNMERRST